MRSSEVTVAECCWCGWLPPATPNRSRTSTASRAKAPPKVIAATAAEARRVNAPGGSIAVVDEGGNLLALERLELTFAASANIAIGKARISALFKQPTQVFEDAITGGRTSMVTLGGDLQSLTPLQGGILLEWEGPVLGAIGVSGAAGPSRMKNSRFWAPNL